MKQMRADLSELARIVGVPEEQLMSQYDAIVREGGQAANLMRMSASEIVPYSETIELKTTEEIYSRFDPEEFAKALRPQPEPTPEKVQQMVTLMRDLLPNFKQQLLSKAKKMPRYKHGGRPEEFDTPEKRQKVREEIKKLREPGVKLQQIYQLLAKRHSVSPTTIKRIWHKKSG